MKKKLKHNEAQEGMLALFLDPREVSKNVPSFGKLVKMDLSENGPLLLLVGSCLFSLPL
jgi:hypothetical protein